jgi:hypothetical protein
MALVELVKKDKEDPAAVPEPAPGRRFQVWKPKGERLFKAHIVLPNGFARARLAKLQRERGVPTMSEEMRARGEIPTHERHRMNLKAKAAGLPVPFPPGHRGNAPGLAAMVPRRGPAPIPTPAEPSSEWRSFARTYEQRCMQAFMRITELMLLGTADDPQAFVDHIRAVVLETMEGARKARGPGRPRGGGY